MTNAPRRRLGVVDAKQASEVERADGSADCRFPAWALRWLKRAWPLVGEDPDLQRQWECLELRAHRSHFEVAIIGEMGRGKTATLRELLHDAAIPAAEPERLLRLVAGKTGLVRDSNEHGSSLGDPCIAPETATVKLRISSAWMRKNDVQILEVPSRCLEVNSPSGGQWPIADCVLLVLQATAPFGQLDTARVIEAVERHAIPLVVVVIRHLDRVPEEDWARVLAFISARAESIDGDIRIVLAGPGEDEDRAAVSSARSNDRYLDLAGLRSLLESELRSPSHRHRVSRQVALRALVLIERARTRIDQAIECWRREEEIRERCRAATRVDHQKRADGCKSAVQIWQIKKVDAEEALRRKLEEQRNRIAEALRSNLDRSSNPKVWLNRDMLPCLKRELQRAEQQLSLHLNQRLLEDRKVLDPLQKTHGFRLAPASRVHLDLFPPEDPSRDEIESADVLDPALMGRLTRIAGAAVGSLLFWKLQLLALLPTTLVSQLGEGWVGHRLEKAKAELGAAIGVSIDRLANKHRVGVLDALSEAYNDVLAQIRTAEKSWNSALQETPTRTASPPQYLTDLLRLAKDLEAELELHATKIREENPV